MLALPCREAASVAWSRDANPHIQRQACENNGEHAGDREHDFKTFLDDRDGKARCPRDHRARIPPRRVPAQSRRACMN
jgi:hypothetical protein